MTNTTRSLHRLIHTDTAENLLRSFHPLFDGQPVALIDSDGRVYAGRVDPVQAQSLRAACLGAGQMVPGCELVERQGWSFYPLFIEDLYVGSVATLAPGHAARALHHSLELLLEENQQKRRIARETLDRYREINLMYRATENIGASLDTQQIANLVIHEALRAIQSDCAVVLLYLPGNQVGDLHIVQGPYAQAVVETLQANLPNSHPVEKPGVILDPQHPFSVLYAPLRSGGQTAGLVAISRQSNLPEFSAADQKFFAALAGQAGIAVERARLHQHEILRQRMEQELAISRKIQLSLLPKALPASPGWDFAASYLAASQVGGDFYDVFELPGDGQPDFGILIGDVTGKGVPAALMMAFSRAILHSAALLSASPADTLRRANQTIIQDSRSGLFLSVFYAVLNPRTGLLRCANAGHEPPVLVDPVTGHSRLVDTGRSLLLGVSRDMITEEWQCTLPPGSTFFLYTDGVTEARSPAGDFYTEERLLEAIRQEAGCPLDSLCQAIMQSVQAFSASAPQSDDLTVLAVRREP